MVRFILPAFLLLSTAAQADEVTGKVVAFDRVAKVIVMQDKTIFEIKDPAIVPADLKAGETITIDFKQDGDNGIVAIQSITRS